MGPISNSILFIQGKKYIKLSKKYATGVKKHESLRRFIKEIDGKVNELTIHFIKKKGRDGQDDYLSAYENFKESRLFFFNLKNKISKMKKRDLYDPNLKGIVDKINVLIKAFNDDLGKITSKLAESVKTRLVCVELEKKYLTGKLRSLRQPLLRISEEL